MSKEQCLTFPEMVNEGPIGKFFQKCTGLLLHKLLCFFMLKGYSSGQSHFSEINVLPLI